MPASTTEILVTERHILLVGPYGVLGTGVLDAVAENPKWGSPPLRADPRQTTGRRPHPHTSASILWAAGHDKGFCISR
jgi:hypothetical protein